MYVNGEEHTLNNSTQPNLPTDMFSIGNSPYANENFVGCIEETRFWTVARSQKQIRDSMYVKLTGSVTFASGETSKTIQIPVFETNADGEVSFEVSLTALQGVTLGTNQSATIRITQNNAPTATNVQISGIATIGQILTGRYQYNDAENDAEGGSTFQWYRADNTSGLNRTAISGATSTTYTLSSSDLGQYVSFEVTPQAQTGSSPGTAVQSSFTAMIEKATPTITTAPVAVAISYGDELSDSTLTGGAASVPGTFAWTTPGTKPSVSDSDSTAYSVTFTPTDSDNYDSVTTTVKLTVNKAEANPPVDPVLLSRTQTSVTLQVVAGYEYLRVSNGAAVSTGIWQDSNVFNGLKSGTAYDFYQRMKETVTHQASVLSAKLDVSTKVVSVFFPVVYPTTTPILTPQPLPTPQSEPLLTDAPSPTKTTSKADVPSELIKTPEPTSADLPFAIAEETPVTNPSTDVTPAPKPTTESSGLKTRSITGIILDSTGLPVVGYRVELHSKLFTTLTDQEGRYEFHGVDFENHEPILKTPSGDLLASFALSFSQGDTFSQRLTDKGAEIVFTSTTDAVDFKIKLNQSKTGADILQVTSPEIPPDSNSFTSIIYISLGLAFAVVVFLITVLIRKRSQKAVSPPFKQ